MKFKNLFFGAALATILFACSSEQTTENNDTTVDVVSGTYAVDAATSSVGWKGTMVGIYSHNGTINLTEGSIVVDSGLVKGGSFTVDMKTINPLDSAYSEEHPKEHLVGHLSAADFFATDSFPTASFVIKSVNGNEITGDLTVRGKTNEEKVTDVTVTATDSTISAAGKLVFNRQNYGVAWDAGKDKVLSDDIELEISLVGKK